MKIKKRRKNIIINSISDLKESTIIKIKVISCIHIHTFQLKMQCTRLFFQSYISVSKNQFTIKYTLYNCSHIFSKNEFDKRYYKIEEILSVFKCRNSRKIYQISLKQILQREEKINTKKINRDQGYNLSLILQKSLLAMLNIYTKKRELGKQISCCKTFN